jgi:hypothetical protein
MFLPQVVLAGVMLWDPQGACHLSKIGNEFSIFIVKYKLYMPTEDELKRELAKEQELLEIENDL